MSGGLQRVETTSPVDGEAVGRAAPSGLMMPYVRYTPYSQHSRLRVRPGPNDCLVQTMPIGDWKAALTRFTIQFGDRISVN